MDRGMNRDDPDDRGERRGAPDGHPAHDITLAAQQHGLVKVKVRSINQGLRFPVESHEFTAIDHGHIGCEREPCGHADLSALLAWEEQTLPAPASRRHRLVGKDLVEAHVSDEVDHHLVIGGPVGQQSVAEFFSPDVDAEAVATLGP